MKRTPYTYRKDALEELPPFDPNGQYTERELAMYTDQLLREAGSPAESPFLFQEHIEPRWRKEVYPTGGTPDATITNSLSPDGVTIFNRTHPDGRKVNSDTQRRSNGASYYR
jgi:hypothetical protein